VRPIKFRTANFVMRAPPGSTPEECGDLWIERSADEQGPYIAAVYDFTDEERAAVAAGARLVLQISGHGMPPVALGLHDGPATEKVGEHALRISNDEIREQREVRAAFMTSEE
jgi:hypothetical protein